MRAFRAVLGVVIVANLALLVVFQSNRSRDLKYKIVERQAEIKALELEKRALLLDLAQARRPESLAERAAALKLDIKNIEFGSIVSVSDPHKVDPIAKAPKKPRP